MHGNVWEWCEDRWHQNYRDAPQDGTAWLQGKDSGRVVRGGNWSGSPGDLRSAVRGGDEPGNRFDDLGFRVSRTLAP